MIKTILVIAVLVAVVYTEEDYFTPFRSFVKTTWSKDNPQALWADFKTEHNKVYSSAEEEANRFEFFKTNLEKAHHLNSISKRTNFGVTQFMDLSIDEFKSNVLMTDTSSLRKNMAEMTSYAKDVKPWHNVLNSSIPNAFDWRSRGVITPVYNQGSCGSCWAFSATENIESVWAISGHGLNELSAQEIVDCCDEAQMGCRGGSPAEAYDCTISAGGQDLLRYYPYIGVNGACHFNRAWIGAVITSWEYASASHNEGQMVGFLATAAPISACVDAEPWVYYRGGILTPAQCGDSVDHCIEITGYDLANNPPYWIIRNSWGAGWGSGGYIALEYGTNTCDITSFPTSAIPA